MDTKRIEEYKKNHPKCCRMCVNWDTKSYNPTMQDSLCKMHFLIVKAVGCCNTFKWDDSLITSELQLAEGLRAEKAKRAKIGYTVPEKASVKKSAKKVKGK